jgi:cytidylate kinase
MDKSDPKQYIVEALLRAAEYPRRPEMPHPPRFTIAISREVGAGGRLVAREVGRRLNWPVYDHELLENLAGELHVDLDRLESIDERPGHWLVDCLNAFAAVATVSEVTYFRRLLKLLLALGDQGECVLLGRGATFVLPAASTLRVRLLASHKDRVALIGRERGLNPSEAARYVDTTDVERIRFIKSHFHKDPTEPLHYDLVLNTSRYSVAECAEMIIGALRLLQARVRVHT